MPWDNDRLIKVEKLKEIKMIRCLRVVQYQSRESRTKKKRLTENLYLHPLCTFQPSLSLILPIHTLWVIKGKEKKQIFIFVHQHCCLSSSYTTPELICIQSNDWLVGWLVVFYGISTPVGYLIPNPIYTYIIIIIIKSCYKHGFSLTLFFHLCLSFIVPGRFYNLHPVSNVNNFLLVGPHWHLHV